MTVKRYRVINAEVEAMQLVEGQTTKRQILEFCPDANVGAPAPSMDSTDLRWVAIPTVRSPSEEATYRDWIIKGPAGYFLRDPETFPTSYEEIG